MCNNDSITFTYDVENDDETYTFEKIYAKPPELRNFCPNCDKNNPKKIALLHKFVMNDLYKENLQYINKLKIRDSFKLFKPLFKDQDEDMKGSVITNVRLRKLLADKLMRDNRTQYWNNISIKAPHLSANAKNKIKQNIKYMGTIDEIKDYMLCCDFGFIYDLVFKKKNMSFTLLKNNEPDPQIECQICFKEFDNYKSLCKTCTNPEICRDCEELTKNKYKRCAFCNSVYH